ncbi:Beta-glucosidase 1B like protein [Verticillium longisporum]|nr:Beta-glucosidase 1B like protein [Verticillium longisporum]
MVSSRTTNEQRLQAAGVRSSDAVTYIGATLELFYANIYPIFPVLYRPDAKRALDAMRWQPQQGGIWSDRAFALLAAVCAYTLAVLPTSVSGANWAISEAFFQASKSSLESYAVADIEKPNSSSVFIRHLHAAWQYTAGRSDVSWYIMGEAIRLALSMRLFDERSYDAMEYIEAQMCRRAFWLLYSSDKSAAVSGRRVIGLSRTLFQRVIPPAYPADLGDQDRVSMTASDGLEQELGLSSGFNANHDQWRASEELLAHDDEAAGNPMPESHFVTRIDQNFRCLSAAYYRFQTCLEGLPFVLSFHDAFDATVHSFRFRAADEVRVEVPLALRIQRSNLQITYQALKMVCLRKYPSLFRSPRLDCLDMPAVSTASACSPAAPWASFDSIEGRYKSTGDGSGQPIIRYFPMSLGNGEMKSHSSAAANSPADIPEEPLPRDFEYGTATAAYQIEGGAYQDDKGVSIWDDFTHLEPSRSSGTNGDVTCDHYNRFEQDVPLMKSYGVDSYRFSISWPRIIPLGGRGDAVNEKGVEFYNRLIDCLLAHNIKPVVTLFHWDLPVELEERYGGLLNTDEFQKDFENYARACFTRFGDRVARWITFNEPYIFSIMGYHMGVFAPGHNEAGGFDTTREPWRVVHSMIVAHATAVEAYASDEADRMASQRRMEFYLGWVADPVFLGADYPIAMRAQLGSRLPEFTPEQRRLVRRAAHLNTFFGLNHYSSHYARARDAAPAPDNFNGNVEELHYNSAGEDIGPLSGVFWLRAAPKQFRKLLRWIWTRYSRPIYITENGTACPDEEKLPIEQAVKDDFRVRYIAMYLNSVSKAIYEDGVVVKSYMAWSLMDNLEWSAGYAHRFGITHVDFDTLVRTPKQSAFYLRETMERRRGRVAVGL